MASATSIGGFKGSFYNSIPVYGHLLAAGLVAVAVNNVVHSIFQSPNMRFFGKCAAAAAGIAASVYFLPALFPTATLVSFTGSQALGWGFGLGLLGITSPLVPGPIVGYLGTPALYALGALGGLSGSGLFAN